MKNPHMCVCVSVPSVKCFLVFFVFLMPKTWDINRMNNSMYLLNLGGFRNFTNAGLFTVSISHH